MSDEPMEEVVTEGDAEDGSSRGIWSAIRRHPIRNGAIALVGVSGIVGLAVVMSQWGTPEEDPVTVESLLRMLDDELYDEARWEASQMARNNEATAADRGAACYVIGRSLMQEAQQEWDEPKRRAIHMISARYFQEAAAKGFPEGYEDSGKYYLGTSLYESGLATQSLPAFVHLLEEHPESRHINESLARIIGVYLQDPQLDIEQGQRYCEQLLAREDLTEQQRRNAIIQQCDLLLRQGRFEDVEGQLHAVLDTLPAESPMVAELEVKLGKLWLERNAEYRRAVEFRGDRSKVEMAQQAIDRAIEHLLRAEFDDAQKMNSQYLLGICEFRQGNWEESAELFGKVRRANLDSAQAVPASLGEAESIFRSGDLPKSFAQFVKLLDLAEALDYQSTDWLDGDELESRVADAQRSFRHADRYDLAMELADQMWPPLSRDTALELQAETYAEWAEHVLEEGADPFGAVDEVTSRESRRLYREAALAYYKLSKLRLSSPNYLDIVWDAAENYYRGRDFPKAVELFQQYLDEPPETREARAYLRIGESLMALGQLDDALDSLQRCITFFPNDSDSYRARLSASQILLIRNQPAAAKDLLRFNIEDSNLTPESTVWRDSLFALGTTIYDEALALEIQSRANLRKELDANALREGIATLGQAHLLFQETTDWLSEAVERYRDDPEAIEARYLLAEAHRQSAKYPREQLKIEQIAGTQFRLNQQVADELAIAYDLYDELEQDLVVAQDERPLTEVEQSISRNCSFAKADVLFDQGLYPEAIAAYQTVSNRYHNRPESLEAFCRIASCYRRMNQHDEARGVLAQAKLFLQDRIPIDADYLATSRYTRDQWINVLDWLSSL